MGERRQIKKRKLNDESKSLGNSKINQVHEFINKSNDIILIVL